FTDHPLLSRRGELIVAAAGQQSLLARHEAVVRRVNQRGEWLDADGACARVPVLKRDAVVGAVFEPDAADIDVHALHHGYLRGLRRAGGEVVCNAEATDLWRDGDHWQVVAAGRSYRAPIVVNAAGAWGD